MSERVMVYTNVTNLQNYQQYQPEAQDDYLPLPEPLFIQNADSLTAVQHNSEDMLPLPITLAELLESEADNDAEGKTEFVTNKPAGCNCGSTDHLPLPVMFD